MKLKDVINLIKTEDLKGSEKTIIIMIPETLGVLYNGSVRDVPLNILDENFQVLEIKRFSPLQGTDVEMYDRPYIVTVYQKEVKI